jgi:hypothetical protein
MGQIEISKPVAVATTVIVAAVLILGVWWRSGGTLSPRNDPQEQVTLEQKQAAERADFDRRQIEDQRRD